ncbi:hypothetical protein EUX98_g8094 [Antrodiella citrinella]|uniref:Deacetylase sirtuin-type domain-containing protein n=1 Tax=Antrodiella citrinella TaxID=2447956 RepID=A0A4S4MDZ2_9APHY|nr:hypothetical protein EUX98_g8094 [Antrodiella citrinella]
MTLSFDLHSSDGQTKKALSNLSHAVAKCKKIVVVTGAGISCSSGIPDFRSSDGLYNLVKQQHPDVVLKGRDLFDASLFRDPTSTSVFYTFISQLKHSIDQAAPSPTHHFIKTLDSKHKLLRSYTQNIDGLEERAGLLGTSCQEVRTNGKGKAKLRVKDVRNVQLHGDIHRVRSEARVARSARRLTIGTLRPAIVLYDEPHPLGDDIGVIHSTDITRKPDMLIIMGTSLKVHGLKKLVKDFAKAVHEAAPVGTSSITPSPFVSVAKGGGKHWAGKVIFVNKTAPGSEWDGIIDYHVAGETDRWVEKVVEEWKRFKVSDWEIQTTLDQVVIPENPSAFKIVKEVTNTLGNKGAAAGGKPKPAAKRARKQLVDDLPVMVTLPEPVSPSKRRKSGNHYSDGESSPSKKRAIQSKENMNLDFEGKGMLFGVDPSHTKPEDEFDLGAVPVKEADIDVVGLEEKKRAVPRPKALPRVRLVMGPDTRKSGRRAPR